MKEEIKKILIEIGADVNKEGIRETPVRVERLYKNFFTYDKKLVLVDEKERNRKTFVKNEIPITYFSERIDNLVVKSGEFVSMCSHHILPFYGKYYFAYLPSNMIIGLSKIDSLVRYFSGRLQIQEKLGEEIVDWFYKNFKPKFVMIVLVAKHLCELLTNGKNGVFVTSAIRGDLNLKDEVLKLIGGGKL
ncbi:MAG: GTP cyclohydrolase I [Candidatus Aenigmatarchaeota archaeon]